MKKVETISVMQHKPSVMNKQLFLETIEALQKQDEHDMNCKRAFEVILSEQNDNIITRYDNFIVTNMLIKLLEDAMNDKWEWIRYFIYRLEFGSKYYKGIALHRNGKAIDLSTASKLYDYLKRNK